jgi:hypothetical protein
MANDDGFEHALPGLTDRVGQTAVRTGKATENGPSRGVGTRRFSGIGGSFRRPEAVGSPKATPDPTVSVEPGKPEAGQDVVADAGNGPASR